ncbi:MAG: NAD-dependent epimerase/dehydratase family protein [bacterium]
MSTLKGKKVLVTGATGFIGGRIVERLVLEQRAEVRAMVRDFSRAARLARFDCVKMVKAALSDRIAIEDAVDGCDVVFHCAYDWKSKTHNLDGIRLLTEACIRHNVRLVHLSSIAVYEPLKDGELDETEKSLPSGLTYTDTKIEIEEEIFRKIVGQGLKAVILQPTIVYGPFSPWTITPVQQLLSGRVILPDEGKGLCNAVYVDDVCEAMILSTSQDGGVGERFLISGAEPVSWGDFFGAYETILGVKAISYMSEDEIRKTLRNPVSNLKLLLADPKRITQWKLTRDFAFFLLDNLPDWAESGVMALFSRYQKIAPRPTYLPSNHLLNIYSANCRVRIDKAKRLLGYEPKYDLSRGMELTAEYINWAFPRFNDLKT